MIYSEDNHSWSYALFSAHLHRYMPRLKWEQHQFIYQQWCNYHLPKPLHSNLIWNTDAIESLPEAEPSILVLYHLGMHAYIPQILAENNIQFDILMDRKVFAKHQEEMSALRDLCHEKGTLHSFLMSDDPSVLLKARTTMRAGRHLLIFADGNSGTKDTLERKLKVSFLESSIYVRKGIAVLSFLLQMPIVPLAHSVKDGRYYLFMGEEIFRLSHESREDYLLRSMQLLFQFLANQIKDEPWRWECWAYLHVLNCYKIKSYITPNFSLKLAENIHIQLEERNGIFNRKYFCYQFE
ncbi:hypothetical protein [Sphingobacterium multivorum]|uniref:hypothetical protein n=1 Tax=Sphingobacterium multivorum TaxID=28454 RepID=UPI0028AE0C51|nr:hypothetical protein [Sphingobacterium multivorum]